MASSLIPESVRNFIMENKEPLYLASTVGLGVYSGYSFINSQALRYGMASGIITSCFLQIFGIANGHKGIADPKSAPRLTNLIATINLASWFISSNEAALGFALWSASFKVTTVVFQIFSKDSQKNL